jgi:hypothetical protein
MHNEIVKHVANLEKEEKLLEGIRDCLKGATMMI